jgi:hypothetical protein
MDEIIFILYLSNFRVLTFDFLLIILLIMILFNWINLHVQGNLIIVLILLLLFNFNLANKMVVILLQVNKVKLQEYNNLLQMNDQI